jgi:hypothetical protein
MCFSDPPLLPGNTKCFFPIALEFARQKVVYRFRQGGKKIVNGKGVNEQDPFG